MDRAPVQHGPAAGRRVSTTGKAQGSTETRTFRAWTDVPIRFGPCVYFLADPRTPNRPRYVGATINPRGRLSDHQRGKVVPRDDVFAWFCELRAHKLKPVMRVVARYATGLDAQRAEWRLAWRWKRRGLRIVGFHRPPADDRDLFYKCSEFRNCTSYRKFWEQAA